MPRDPICDIDDDEQPVRPRSFRGHAVRVFWYVAFALFFMGLGALLLSLYSDLGGRF